ncbi:MAG TPA: hypothetical protein HA364_08780, partial [Thermoplasmata archaeon]|nr:hypothetical protein [Thermoplasmata archaeon]
MAFTDFIRRVTIKGWALGGAFIAAGLLSLILALSAHMGALELMPTTDPDDLQRISDLEDQRAVMVNLAFGALFVGVFTIFVMTERTLPADIAQRQMMSQVRLTNELVENLNLKGSAAYIPAKYALTREKVMIPATANTLSMPIMTDDL